MNNVLFGAIMPHPPILVPFVGGERIKEAEKSQKALIEVAKKIKSLENELDAIVVITPHGAVSEVTVPVYTSHIFEGNFVSFGFPKPNFQYKGCPELAVALAKEAAQFASRSPETVLDHGVLVPLYYLNEEKINLPILPIAIGILPLNKLFEFGKKIRTAAENLNKKIAVIASADMSHRLTEDAPSGYDPKGSEFDKKLFELVRNYDVKGILNFSPKLAAEAGQDALWSIAILLGALDGIQVKHEILSYEGPFGVGYMVAVFEPSPTISLS